MIWVKFYKSIWYEKRLKTTNPDNASYRDLFIILRRYYCLLKTVYSESPSKEKVIVSSSKVRFKLLLSSPTIIE